MNVQGVERLELLRRRLEADGRLVVADPAGDLAVSEVTIRRDLEVLVDEGVARRVRGGAVAAGAKLALAGSAADPYRGVVRVV